MSKEKIPEYRTPQRTEKLRGVLERRQPGLTAVFENINDPHNLSACLRSCDAVGILKVHLVYYGSQPFPKLGRQSSASAMKWVETVCYDSVKECFEALRAEGKKIYTTHMSRESVSLYDLKLDSPAALVFGNEHAGVSDEAHSLADGNFLIPQAGMIQSLNISVACAVSLFEAYRQRMEAGLYATPQIEPEILEARLEEWLRK